MDLKAYHVFLLITGLCVAIVLVYMAFSIRLVSKNWHLVPQRLKIVNLLCVVYCVVLVFTFSFGLSSWET